MVNTHKQKLTVLQEEILTLFYKKSGLTLNQRQIAKYLNVSAPAIKKSLPLLEELNFIKLKKDKETKRLSIQLNLENHKIIQLKRVSNLKQLYETGFVDFIEEKFAGGTIILFGSYSKGEDIFNSDIDVAIIQRKEKDIDLTVFEKQLERKIHLLFFDSFKKINIHLKNNILNGVTLSGSIEL